MEEPVIPEGRRSLDLRGFPLFTPIGVSARRGADHLHFARLPAGIPVTELSLSRPALRALKIAGISTIGELVLTPSSEVAEILKSAGRTRLRGLRDQVRDLIEERLVDAPDGDLADDEPEQLILEDEVGEVTGYEVGADWDETCPTCWSAVETTDYVTPDDETVYRCTSCGEHFYIESEDEATVDSPRQKHPWDAEQEDHPEGTVDELLQWSDAAAEAGGRGALRENAMSGAGTSIGPRSSSSRTGSTSDSVREKAASLFRFLREVVQLRTTSARSVAQYERDGRVIWLADVPREPQCLCAAWSHDEARDEANWLEVTRTELKHHPAPPELLRPWLDPADLADSDLAYPDLRESLPAALIDPEADDDTGEVRFEDAPGVFDDWSRYIEDVWQPWAAADRRGRHVQALYNDLFSIHQTLLSRGDEFELVVGWGLLQWRVGGHEIKRHLVTANAELSFESERGRMTVGPLSEGMMLRLEQEMLEVTDRPGPEQVAAISADLDRISGDVWHGDAIRTVLRRWVNSVSPDGSFADELAAETHVTESPEVTWAPALILRKRTSRPLLDFYESVIGKLDDGEECPEGVAALVEIAGVPESQDRDVSPSPREPEEVYFPLPANDEQLQILRRLKRGNGVLVQGPPGTGKSHTIANLIAHLLATGQRVLVTSQTPRALRVLQEKLPNEIADLCVLLLGDDRAAMSDLDRSVQAITQRYNHWDLEENLRRVRETEQRLDQARRCIERDRAELLALRESEVDEFRPLGGVYSGSLATIAKQLGEEREEYGWLKLSGDWDPNAGSPLTNAEALELLRLARSLATERKGLFDQSVPPISEMPSPDEFERWVTELAAARHACRDAVAAADERLIEQLRSTAGANTLRSLSAAALSYGRLLASTHGEADGVLVRVVRDLLVGRGARWTSLKDSLQASLARIEELGPACLARTVTEAEGRGLLEIRHDAEGLRAHLQAGGSLGNFIHRAAPVRQARYIVEGVRVDGRAATTPDVLSEFCDWLEASSILDKLDAEWRGTYDAGSGGLAQRVAAYRDLAAELTRAAELHRAAVDLRSALEEAGGNDRIDWLDSRAVARLATDVSVAIDCIDLASREARFASLADTLEDSASQADGRDLLKLLVSSIRGADAEAFRGARSAVVDASRVRDESERRALLLGRMTDWAEETSEVFLGSFADPVWDERIKGFERAWAWAQADRWLERSLTPGALEKVTKRLQRHEDDVRSILNELAATRAWGHCLGSMTDAERMHLVAWSKAVRKIGKGTGKYAARHRREARENMEQCRSAIPAWVMPLYRVAETVRPGRDSFDVVIVDEASQSGLDSLFLHYLGAKLIVVGDDKQISPENVGVNRQDVEDLRRQHIPDIPLSTTFGVETSLFDQAEIRFGNRVRLREHFRCMPEIIEFSNQLQYKGEPLVPLRQFSSGRLVPIVLRHVPDGHQEGSASSAVNRPEAEALVAAVVARCSDPSYEGATMGVISLLGEAQARHIERLLLERLGPEEMEERRLTCGDAYSFQGDERNIMFLTMVSAPNARIGTLSDEKARRRFNVAVSRAKDQLWLFHTATPRDLSPTCVRRALLEYCANPAVWRTVADGAMTVDDLERVRREAAHREEKPPSPFDSWFEVDVFLAMATRGYRVAPQHEVAGYRIDMVVEGARGRLAVECDGDEVHGGTEQFESDIVRQRRLERCGWSFWRVGGGEFYRDPEAALKDLWRTLERHGIRPASGEDVEPGPTHDSPTSPLDSVAESVASAPLEVPPAIMEAPAAVGFEVQQPRGQDLASEARDCRHAYPAYRKAHQLDVNATLTEAQKAEALAVHCESQANPSNQAPVDVEGQAAASSAPESWSAQPWRDYETVSGAEVLPDLEDGPENLPLSRGDDTLRAGERPSAQRASDSGWLSHGVLGSLDARTVPKVAPYRVAQPVVDTFGLHLSRVPRASLAEIIVKVVEVESPVLVDDVASRVADAAGLGKVHGPTEKAFRDAAAYASSNHMLVRCGQVLWSNGDQTAVIRSRRKCPGNIRLSRCVPTEELEWAVHRTVWTAGTIRRHDSARATARLLGFKRTSEQLSKRVDAALAKAVAAGAMDERAGLFSLAGGGRSPTPNRAGGRSGGGGPFVQSDESQAAEQARVLIGSLLASSQPRAVLTQIHGLGPEAIGPLIGALADSRLARLAVTALVEFGPIAKSQLVRALDSTNRQVRIHAGEVLSRAGLDEDL